MQVLGKLVEFRSLVRDVVRSACRTALLNAGFTPDDYFYENMDTSGGNTVLLLPPLLTLKERSQVK